MLKNLNSALISTFMITCIKSAILKMSINAGTIPSSLESKRHILFYTLTLNVIRAYLLPIEYYCLFPGIPALVDCTK